MIRITDKAKCCGCNACVQRCPKQCITMQEDEEGFLYPVVDMSNCIDCRLCEKVCPILNQNASKEPLQVFAAKNRNENQRLRSSSGGIFILLAEYIIRQGGVVFGARFDKNWEVEHTYAETFEELEPLMRSKYVQSRIGNTYKETEHFLKQGRMVLFVGTPCQIAGLKKFLHKDYENLLAVDFICHGVPSPGIWRKYLEEIQSEQARQNSVSSSLKYRPVITGINFREKQLGGYSWKKYGFVIHSKSLSEGERHSVLLSTNFKANIYAKGFLSNLYLRPSCYQCPAKAGRSLSDLTIGDFWGINTLRPDIDDNKGVGAVLVYTTKGENVFRTLNIESFQMTYKEVILVNPIIYASVSQTKKRIKFWKSYFKTNNLTRSISRTLQLTLWQKFLVRIKLVLRKCSMIK